MHGELGVVNNAGHHSLCPRDSRSHCDCRHKCCGKQSPPQWPLHLLVRPAIFLLAVCDKTLIYGGEFSSRWQVQEWGEFIPAVAGRKVLFYTFIYFPPSYTLSGRAVTRLMHLFSRSDLRGQHSWPSIDKLLKNKQETAAIKRWHSPSISGWNLSPDEVETAGDCKSLPALTSHQKKRWYLSQGREIQFILLDLCMSFPTIVPIWCVWDFSYFLSLLLRTGSFSAVSNRKSS